MNQASSSAAATPAGFAHDDKPIQALLRAGWTATLCRDARGRTYVHMRNERSRLWLDVARVGLILGATAAPPQELDLDAVWVCPYCGPGVQATYEEKCAGCGAALPGAADRPWFLSEIERLRNEKAAIVGELEWERRARKSGNETVRILEQRLAEVGRGVDEGIGFALGVSGVIHGEEIPQNSPQIIHDIAALRAERDELRAQVQTLQTQATQLATKYEQIETKFRFYRDAVKVRDEMLQRQHDELQSANKDLRDKCESEVRLIATVADLSTRIHEARDELLARATRVEGERDTARAEVEKLRAERDKADDTASERLREIVKLREALRAQLPDGLDKIALRTEAWSRSDMNLKAIGAVRLAISLKIACKDRAVLLRALRSEVSRYTEKCAEADSYARSMTQMEKDCAELEKKLERWAEVSGNQTPEALQYRLSEALKAQAEKDGEFFALAFRLEKAEELLAQQEREHVQMRHQLTGQLAVQRKENEELREELSNLRPGVRHQYEVFKGQFLDEHSDEVWNVYEARTPEEAAARAFLPDMDDEEMPIWVRLPGLKAEKYYGYVLNEKRARKATVQEMRDV